MPLGYLARGVTIPNQEGLDSSGFEDDQETGLDMLNWRDLSDIQVERSIRSMVYSSGGGGGAETELAKNLGVAFAATGF